MNIRLVLAGSIAVSCLFAARSGAVAADKPSGSTKYVPWVTKMFESFDNVNARRLELVESSAVEELEGAVRVIAEYAYLDPSRNETRVQAKLILPSKPEEGQRFPLYFSAGYELDDPTAVEYAGRGYVVVTQHGLGLQPQNNPLSRTVNPDAALLHIARALPMVDDTRVVISGASAGGYMTLELAAETFPLAGAAPDVAPINLGFNAAYFTRQRDKILAHRVEPEAPNVPALTTVLPIMEVAASVYGDDQDARIWHLHSAVRDLKAITCPVSAYWSTADVLVPMDEIDKQWVQPFDAAKFPPGWTMDPDDIMKSDEGRIRLMDVLKPEDYTVIVAPIPEQIPDNRFEIPDDGSKQWSIAILDEGPPTPACIHFKHWTCAWRRSAFLDRVMSQPIAVEQLTQRKLERLMARYRGEEWMPTKLKHLDLPECDRADVLRGLKTYVAISAAHAARFEETYAALPRDKQSLSSEDLTAIRNAAATE